MSRWLLVPVVALALAGCTSDAPGATAGSSPTASASSASSSPSATATPAPPPEPPADEACYRLSYDEAVAPTTSDPPVPCRNGHTSQTYAVGRLDLVDNGHLLAVDSKAARTQVARRCPTRLSAYLGATRDQLRLSLLRPVWFTPTIEESDAGADWYRCDVIAVTGEQTLARFDGSLARVMAEPEGRDEFGMCGTAQPGTKEFRRVLCRDDHSWRAIDVVELTGKGKRDAYPGPDTVREAGQEPCAEAAREIASDPLDYEWGYEWPTKDQWQAGQTYGRCWSPDPA